MGRFSVIQKKEMWTLTWQGYLIVLFILILINLIFVKNIVPFLSPNEPVSSSLMVVEGFLPDYALENTMELFISGNYSHLVITGKEREKGAHLDQYTNDGEFTAAILLEMGFDAGKLTVAATDTDIRKDRTYESALAVRAWVEENRPTEQSINLVSMGPHSRRSRYLFDKAFEGKIKIGVHAISSRSYDQDRWWQSSHGFREINKEAIAWIYARFFFYP